MSGVLMNSADHYGCRKITVQKPTITFADVAGYTKTKKEIKEAIEDRKNLFLFGPPGCGKSYMAKAIAGEYETNLIRTNLSDTYVLRGDYTADLLDCIIKNIQELFELAKENQPCIMIFDGVGEGVGCFRGDWKLRETCIQTSINQIIAGMDESITYNRDVPVIATAYSDNALMRCDRFKIIYVPTPDLKDREEILKFHSKKKSLAAAVKFKSLAELTEGYSCSDLRMVVIEATDIPWKEAFHVVKAKTEDYIKLGLSPEEAEQKAGAETTPRLITMNDFEKALAKRKPSLPSWYAFVKKQITLKNFTEEELRLFKEFLDDIKKKA